MFHVTRWWVGVHISLAGRQAGWGWVGCREGQTGGPSFEMRLEGYRLNVSRRVVVGGCSQVGGLSGGGWAAERDRQVGPVLR
jgi:hypothetical protein